MLLRVLAYAIANVLIFYGFFLKSSVPDAKTEFKQLFKNSPLLENDFLSTISKSRPLRIWTMNMHRGTRLEMNFVLKSLLGLPVIFKATSAEDVAKLIGNPTGMITACPHPHVQRRRFFEVMRKKPEFAMADILYHEMKPGNTEFLMPFNKTIIYYLSTSHEFGRENPIQLREWYLNLIRLSKDKRSAVVANNPYQQRNLLYFTGVKSHYIPSLSLYTGAQWKNPQSHLEIALVGGRTLGWYGHELFNQTNEVLLKMGAKMRLKLVRDVFENFKYPDLINFPCAVFMPYTISTMSHFEYYNMGIPSFYPNLDYIVKLEGDDFAAGQARGYRIYWKGLPMLRGGAFIEKDCKLPQACTNPHDLNATAEERRAWWRLADFYQFKNAIYFDSAEDLARKLVTTNFAEVGRRMRQELKRIREESAIKWHKILVGILNPMPSGGYKVPADYYAAMEERWNVTRADLDESEEAEGPACVMYGRGPGPMQTPGPKFV